MKTAKSPNTLTLLQLEYSLLFIHPEDINDICYPENSCRFFMREKISNTVAVVFSAPKKLGFFNSRKCWISLIS
jgi:hypothetical protein